MTLTDLLAASYPTELAQHVAESFTDIHNNFVLRKWKPSELDAGHFVESVRRIIELELGGSYTPFTVKISTFSDAIMKQYESGSGHISFKLLIPRVLRVIYDIRNNRGVGHVGEVSPNEIDATLILYSSKWVLAEILRLKSGLPLAEATRLIETMIERQISIIWKSPAFTKILSTAISPRDQVLILLSDTSPQADVSLQQATDYKDRTNFRKILQRLHNSKLIHYDSQGFCHLSPLGEAEAERLITGSQTG